MNPETLRAAALAWHNAGYCVIPIRSDGTKSPALADWKTYQERLPNDTEIANWFAPHAQRQGFGVVCGAVSGNLEMFEFEGAAVTEGYRDRFLELIDTHDLGEVWGRVATGYAELTPSLGLHYLYRVTDGPALGNVKLARRLATEEEVRADPKAQVRVLIETRGEGGQTVMAPSFGATHSTGLGWVNFYGNPTTVAHITCAERDALHAIARMLNQVPDRPAPATPRQPRILDGTESPMERYNREADWFDILIPHGWQYVCQRGETSWWLRPGKDPHDLRGGHGCSATTGHKKDEAGADLMYVFSTSVTDLDIERSMSKAYVKSLLDFNGDMAAMLAAWIGDETDWIREAEEKRIREVIDAPFRYDPSQERGPAPKMTKSLSPFFHKEQGEMGHQFQALTLCEALEQSTPIIRTSEGIAIYRDGVYRTDPIQFTALCTELLGNMFSTHYIREVERAILPRLGPPAGPPNEPLLNLRNGMLDLRTLDLLPHDPSYRSILQLDTSWAPGAACPIYDSWIREAAQDQVEELEEVTSLMLDPSRVPQKAIFLYGPSRSGKSTYLRLMIAMVGARNVSGVTLHQLADDRFAAANLFGKMLNVGADLSSSDVKDISTFKVMTGEDLVTANRKYGAQFDFTNRAMFAFSANDVPAVSDASTAYFERIMPFGFEQSFAGRERPAIEDELRTELPGILVRWAQAGLRVRARGGSFPRGESRVRTHFEAQSDRVRRFVDEVCVATPGSTTYLTTTELYRAFDRWMQDQGGARLGRNSFGKRLSGCPGVEAVIAGDKVRGYRLVTKPSDQWP